MNGSVRPSVCPSVCLSHLFHYVAFIVSSWNFQGLLPMTEVRNMQKVKVTEVKTLFSRLQTVTRLNSHMVINDAQALMLLRKGALLFFKVIRKFQGHMVTHKSLILTQNGHFRTVTPIWIHRWIWNDAQSLKQCPIVFQGHLSNLKVTWDKKSSILNRIARFWTVTPVWIHLWIWNEAQCLT